MLTYVNLIKLKQIRIDKKNIYDIISKEKFIQGDKK